MHTARVVRSLVRRQPSCFATTSGRSFSKNQRSGAKRPSIPASCEPCSQNGNILDDVERFMKERAKARADQNANPIAKTPRNVSLSYVTVPTVDSLVKVPEIAVPPTPRAPNAFDAKAYESYSEILDSILEGTRPPVSLDGRLPSAILSGGTNPIFWNNPTFRAHAIDSTEINSCCSRRSCCAMAQTRKSGNFLLLAAI
jgi:hypothetical protein